MLRATLRGCVERADRWLGELSPPHIHVLVVGMVFAIGFLDYSSGFELSLSVVYLGPVSIATWYAGRRIGFAIALLSALVCIAADVASGYYFSHPAYLMWNAMVLLAFYAIDVWILGTLRLRLTAEVARARTDALTGLLNARGFVENLESQLALAERVGSSVTLVYVDLDDFKSINDTLGHAEGDRVLSEIGRIIADSTRRSDTVARLGGDEFALLLQGADTGAAKEIIASFTKRLAGSLGAIGRGVTCSIGAVTFQSSPTGADHALRIADRLMYEVKNNGKNNVAFHDWNEYDASTV